MRILSVEDVVVEWIVSLVVLLVVGAVYVIVVIVKNRSNPLEVGKK